MCFHFCVFFWIFCFVFLPPPPTLPPSLPLSCPTGPRDWVGHCSVPFGGRSDGVLSYTRISYRNISYHIVSSILVHSCTFIVLDYVVWHKFIPPCCMYLSDRVEYCAFLWLGREGEQLADMSTASPKVTTKCLVQRATAVRLQAIPVCSRVPPVCQHCSVRYLLGTTTSAIIQTRPVLVLSE